MMSMPRSAEGAAGRFRFAHYARAQVDRTEVAFRSGRVDYAVFSAYDGAATPATLEGVRVTRHGRATELVCAGQAVADFSGLEDALPCDQANALASCR